MVTLLGATNPTSSLGINPHPSGLQPILLVFDVGVGLGPIWKTKTEGRMAGTEETHPVFCEGDSIRQPLAVPGQCLEQCHMGDWHRGTQQLLKLRNELILKMPSGKMGRLRVLGIIKISQL